MDNNPIMGGVLSGPSTNVDDLFAPLRPKPTPQPQPAPPPPKTQPSSIFKSAVDSFQAPVDNSSDATQGNTDEQLQTQREVEYGMLPHSYVQPASGAGVQSIPITSTQQLYDLGTQAKAEGASAPSLIGQAWGFLKGSALQLEAQSHSNDPWGMFGSDGSKGVLGQGDPDDAKNAADASVAIKIASSALSTIPFVDRITGEGMMPVNQAANDLQKLRDAKEMSVNLLGAAGLTKAEVAQKTSAWDTLIQNKQAELQQKLQDPTLFRNIHPANEYVDEGASVLGSALGFLPVVGGISKVLKVGQVAAESLGASDAVVSAMGSQPVLFGAYNTLQAAGEGQSGTDIAKSGAMGVLTGAAFDRINAISSALAKNPILSKATSIIGMGAAQVAQGNVEAILSGRDLPSAKENITQFVEGGLYGIAGGHEAEVGDNVPRGTVVGEEAPKVEEIPLTQKVDEAAHEAATSPQNDKPLPTPLQEQANNFKQGHVQIEGQDVTISHPEGAERTFTDQNGDEHTNTLQDHYGYLKGTTGADGEHIDAFIGPNLDDHKVFVVDQRSVLDADNPETAKLAPFDEHKVIFGAKDAADAEDIYRRNYSDNGGDRVQAVTETSPAELKRFIAEGDTQEPFAKFQQKEDINGSRPTGVVTGDAGSTRATDESVSTGVSGQGEDQIRDSDLFGTRAEDSQRSSGNEVGIEEARETTEASGSDRIAESGQGEGSAKGREVGGGKEIRSGADLASEFSAKFGLSSEQADAVGALADARAETWAKENNASPEDWYKQRIAAVESGGAPSDDALYQAVQSEFYHGTATKFDAFKDEAINSGEGLQAFGYGHYVTEDPEIANWYAKKIEEKQSLSNPAASSAHYLRAAATEAGLFPDNIQPGDRLSVLRRAREMATSDARASYGQRAREAADAAESLKETSLYDVPRIIRDSPLRPVIAKGHLAGEFVEYNAIAALDQEPYTRLRQKLQQEYPDNQLVKQMPEAKSAQDINSDIKSRAELRQRLTDASREATQIQRVYEGAAVRWASEQPEYVAARQAYSDASDRSAEALQKYNRFYDLTSDRRDRAHKYIFDSENSDNLGRRFQANEMRAQEAIRRSKEDAQHDILKDSVQRANDVAKGAAERASDLMAKLTASELERMINDDASVKSIIDNYAELQKQSDAIPRYHTWRELYDSIATLKDSVADASEFYRSAGIDGFSYDANGGFSSDGTVVKNYVVFDPAKARIEEHKLLQDSRASVEFLNDGRAIIRGLQSPDVSSAVHELGHVFRRDLSGDDLRATEKWAGVKNGDWQREHEEKFARGFERYIADGSAPTPKLAGVFEKFKSWMSNIYKRVKGSDIDVQISPEMRDVFDRMLGKDSSPTEATTPSLQYAVQDIPVKSIETRPELQNRDTAYAEESYKNITENFDANQFQPITVWKDPESGAYITANHTRLRAFQDMGKETIPAHEFSGTYDQFKTFAENSNNLGTQETPMERAKLYGKMRAEGKSESDIQKQAKQYEGSAAGKILNLSYIDPRSKISQDVKALSGSDAQTSAAISTMADWIGSAQKQFPELTRQHQNELYDFLKDTYGKEGIARTKTQFTAKVQQAVDRVSMFGDFDREQPLNINGVKPLNINGVKSISRQEREIIVRTQEFKGNLKRAEEARDKKITEFGGKATNPAQKAAVDKAMQPFHDAVTVARREYNEAFAKQASALDEVRKQEIDMFGLPPDVTGHSSAGSLYSGFPIDPALALLKDIKAGITKSYNFEKEHIQASPGQVLRDARMALQPDHWFAKGLIPSLEKEVRDRSQAYQDKVLSLKDAGNSTEEAEALAKREYGNLKDVQAALQSVRSNPDIAANIVRSRNGEIKRKQSQLFASIGKLRNSFSGMSVDARNDMVDRYESGQPATSQKNQNLLDLADKIFKDRQGALNDLARTLDQPMKEDWFERYFPHNYKKLGDTLSVADRSMKRGGGRNLLGDQAFMKQRTFATEKEARDNGFVPLYDNPVDQIIAKAHSIDKYIATKYMLEDVKNRGMRKFIPVGGTNPPFWSNVDDPSSRVFSKDESGSLILRGHYAYPDEVARVLNNELSPGLGGNSLYKSVRGWSATLLRSLLLGPYHGLVMAANVPINHLAHGFYQIQTGEFAAGLHSLNPIEALKDYSIGSRAEKEYNHPGTQSNDLQNFVKSYTAGNGTFVNHEYGDHVWNTMIDAWKSGAHFSAIGRAIPAGFEQVMKPIFDKLIPRLKAGIAFRYIADEIRKNPNMTQDQLLKMSADVVDKMDNRMGELDKNNLHWNHTLRDTLGATVLSTGWNVGTLRELGGGVVDLGKSVANAFRSDASLQAANTPRFNITERSMYAGFAMPLVNAAIAMAIKGFSTGNPAPENVKDLIYYNLGKDTKGNTVYAQPWTYVKDAYTLAGHPLHDLLRGHHTDAFNDIATALSDKANPLLTDAVRLINNRDYDGNPILKENAQPKDWYTVAKQLGSYVLKSVSPFGVQQFMNRPDLTTEQKLRGLVLPHASTKIGMSDAQADTRKILDAQREAGGHEDDNGNMGVRSAILDAYTRGDTERGDALSQAAKQDAQHGGINLTDRSADALYKESKIPVAARAFSKIEHVEKMVDIYREATPQEKSLYKPLLEKKVNGTGDLSDDQKEQYRSEFGLNPPDKQHSARSDRAPSTPATRGRSAAMNNNFAKQMDKMRAGNMNFVR